jgi:hypothetical protein
MEVVTAAASQADPKHCSIEYIGGDFIMEISSYDYGD